MKHLCLCSTVLLVVVPLACATTEIEHAYVGKSSCSAGLQWGTGSYGIRLDKAQMARLEARSSSGKKLLMIVQYKKEWDDCGTVRDIIETKNTATSFRMR